MLFSLYGHFAGALKSSLVTVTVMSDQHSDEDKRYFSQKAVVYPHVLEAIDGKECLLTNVDLNGLKGRIYQKKTTGGDRVKANIDPNASYSHTARINDKVRIGFKWISLEEAATCQEATPEIRQYFQNVLDGTEEPLIEFKGESPVLAFVKIFISNSSDRKG